LTDLKRPSLVKPTLETRFHIDFGWWEAQNQDWRVYLHSYLCPEHQKAFADKGFGELIDAVDPDTAEVQRVDGMQHVLMTHCARLPDFIPEHATLVDAVFRVFLANGNTSLSAVELGERLGKSPQVILKTLSDVRAHRGIRPCLD